MFLNTHRLLFALFIVCFSCNPSSGQKVSSVNNQDVVEQVIDKNVQLVDVRTAKEYEAGHIDDAVNFDVMQGQKFLEQISSLDKKEPVYLYCKSGVRSKKAAELLKREGFTKIFDYSGGYDDWLRSKH